MPSSLGPCGTCQQPLIRPVQTIKAKTWLHHLSCWQEARAQRLDAQDASRLTAGDMNYLVSHGATLHALMGRLYDGRGMAGTRSMQENKRGESGPV